MPKYSQVFSSNDTGCSPAPSIVYWKVQLLRINNWTFAARFVEIQQHRSRCVYFADGTWEPSYVYYQSYAGKYGWFLIANSIANLI